MKVGTVLALETVPDVKSIGPKPMMPSTPLKPDDEVAAPIDCWETVSPPNSTVSVPACQHGERTQLEGPSSRDMFLELGIPERLQEYASKARLL